MSDFFFNFSKLKVYTAEELQMDKESVKNRQNVDELDLPDDQVEAQVFFPPRISLPLVEIKSLEEDEELVVQMRARIYRYDTDEEDGREFKERGTGLLKILFNPETGAYRVVMRRDITYKVCANHLLLPGMKLEYHNGSDKVFLYSTTADYFEGETNAQTFAIRFRTPEIASCFKNAFEESVEASGKTKKSTIKKEDDENDDKENYDSDDEPKVDKDKEKDDKVEEKIKDDKESDKQEKKNKEENDQNIENLSKRLEKNIEISDK